MSTIRILKTWVDAHTCDKCRLDGNNTLATHSTTDMREVPGGYEETKKVRFGCAEHPVIPMAFLLDGNVVPWAEVLQK